MKLFVLMAVLAFSGIATAGTFELSDPAAELREAQQQHEEELARLRAEREAQCAIDPVDGSCNCFDADTGKFVEVSEELCVSRAKGSKAESDAMSAD